MHDWHSALYVIDQLCHLNQSCGT